VLLPSTDEASYIWRGLLHDVPGIQEECANQNQYCLNRNVLSTYLTLSKKPLRTMADFQGMTVRGMPGPYFSRLMEEAGATNNSALPVVDVYEALMRGVVDAVMLVPQDFEALKYYELAKYVSLPVGCIVALTCNINLDVWNSLPSKTQKALTKAATEWGANEMEHQLTTFNQSIENLKAQGVQFVEFNQEDWNKMLAQAGDPWDAARSTLVTDLKVDAAVVDKYINRWRELYEEYEKEYVSPGKTWEYK
jgi:TRAP-type C4-dicarboxylate transport system substrate-binding protein